MNKSQAGLNGNGYSPEFQERLAAMRAGYPPEVRERCLRLEAEADLKKAREKAQATMPVQSMMRESKPAVNGSTANAMPPLESKPKAPKKGKSDDDDEPFFKTHFSEMVEMKEKGLSMEVIAVHGVIVNLVHNHSEWRNGGPHRDWIYNDGSAWIVKMFRIKKRRAQRVLAELEAAGFLIRLRSPDEDRGRPVEYSVKSVLRKD